MLLQPLEVLLQPLKVLLQPLEVLLQPLEVLLQSLEVLLQPLEVLLRFYASISIYIFMPDNYNSIPQLVRSMLNLIVSHKPYNGKCLIYID